MKIVSFARPHGAPVVPFPIREYAVYVIALPPVTISVEVMNYNYSRYCKLSSFFGYLYFLSIVLKLYFYLYFITFKS